MSRERYIQLGLISAVVLMLIALIVGIVAFVKYADNSKISFHKSDISAMEESVKLYRAEKGNLPYSREDIEKSGYFENLGKINWGWPQYKFTGLETKKGEYRVQSYLLPEEPMPEIFLVFYWDDNSERWTEIHIAYNKETDEWKSFLSKEQPLNSNSVGYCKADILEYCRGFVAYPKSY